MDVDELAKGIEESAIKIVKSGRLHPPTVVTVDRRGGVNIHFIEADPEDIPEAARRVIAMRDAVAVIYVFQLFPVSSGRIITSLLLIACGTQSGWRSCRVYDLATGELMDVPPKYMPDLPLPGCRSDVA